MRTDLRALEAPVTPGQVTVIEIEVANTADVIDGITARVEGLDPGMGPPAHAGAQPVPGLDAASSRSTSRFPQTTVVGDYLVVVHIESTIDPARHSTHDLWLHVEPMVDATLRLRPSVVTKGKTATFAAIVTNKGNVTTDFTMGAADETRVLDCRAVPLTLTVPAGQQAEAEVWVRGPATVVRSAVARTVHHHRRVAGDPAPRAGHVQPAPADPAGAPDDRHPRLDRRPVGDDLPPRRRPAPRRREAHQGGRRELRNRCAGRAARGRRRERVRAR